MKSTKEIVKRMIDDDVLPNNLRDTKHLIKYLHESPWKENEQDLILLALGETWEKISPKLVDLLNETSKEEHGYLMSMYGLPELRNSLKKYISSDEKWPDTSVLELAVNLSGTRNAMIDIGKYILDIMPAYKKNLTPYFISTNPGWDYEGVYNPLGFKSKLINLNPESGFQININDFDMAIKEIEKDPNGFLALIIINPQHNPTGNNIDESVIRSIINMVASQGCGLLIDNAYYGSTHYQEKTSALKVVIEEWDMIVKNDIDHLIFATRTLGKQFHCNGWGIGALIASPNTLDVLVNYYRPIHSYNYFGFLQSTMSKWISSKESSQYLINNSTELIKKQEYISDFFKYQLNYPLEKFHIGKYTPYMLFEIPPRYQKCPQSLEYYIEDLFFKTGVLLTDCWAKPRSETLSGDLYYVRMFTGVDEEKLKIALNRMLKEGFLYQ